MSEEGAPSESPNPAPKAQTEPETKTQPETETETEKYTERRTHELSADDSISRLEDLVAPTSSRRVDRLLAEYGESHQNIINKIIHWLAVPVIAWCVMALLWSLPYPALLEFVPGLNWAWIIAGLSIIYYLTLSIPLALGMTGFMALSFFIIGAYLNWGDLPLWQLAIALFVVAWIFQFIGHKIEGRRPSFFKDLQFLLIGPAWLLAALFRLFGVRY